MRDAVIIALNLDPNAAAPHRVAAVQSGDRRLKREPQVSHGVVGINRNRVAAVRMCVERAYHGFQGGIV